MLYNDLKLTLENLEYLTGKQFIISFVQSAQYNITYSQFSKSFDVNHNLFETVSGEMQSFS